MSALGHKRTFRNIAAAFPKPIEQRCDGYFRVGLQADRNPRKPAKRILSVIDLDDFLAVFEDLAEALVHSFKLAPATILAASVTSSVRLAE
jgi:hypothetical protein